MLSRVFSGYSRPVVGGILALALLGASVPLESASADGTDVTNCIRSFGEYTCVERWNSTGDPSTRRPPDPQEEAESAERERQWEARCHPVVREDQYGVARYQYAAPGCEFGKFQD